MPVNFKLRAIARERERERERDTWRRFTIDFTFYAYVINVYGRFVLYFHLHYQVIPKIACVFS